MAGKTHSEWENDSFQLIFGILVKFPIQYPKTLQILSTVRWLNGVKVEIVRNS